MRTTVTLTPEAESLVRRLMHQRGMTFKDAVNTGIIRGLAPKTEVVDTPVHDLGRARVPVEKALSLAGELEDEALLSKRELGK